jgi:hypothetical protein
METGAANEALYLCRVVEREDTVYESRCLSGNVTRERFPHDGEESARLSLQRVLRCTRTPLS